MTLPEFFDQISRRTEEVLSGLLPTNSASTDRLQEAMRYSVLDGGKRLRPCLVYATGDCLGVDRRLLDAPAAAVELLHSYSLIHDDLPAMDNDDLRRGKPSCHKAFGEGIAILAGDTLQCLAFEQLVNMPVDDARSREMLRVLTDAAGAKGLAGGQAIDLVMTGRDIDIELLEHMHRLKTGALIQASVLLGAKLSEHLSPDSERALNQFGAHLGLSFQIMDDILDVESCTGTLGKPQGSDQRLSKATYPALIGVTESRKRAEQLLDAALQALTALEQPTELLADIAQFVVTRKF